MADKTYRTWNLVGSSRESVEDAIAGAIQTAATEAPGKLDWFVVKEIRGRIDGQQVAWYQVALEIGGDS